jgi:hypothetical protein
MPMSIDTGNMVQLTSSAEPTAQLRWIPGGINPLTGQSQQTLQQAWRITTYHNGTPHSLGWEWRDVPFEPFPSAGT